MADEGMGEAKGKETPEEHELRFYLPVGALGRVLESATSTTTRSSHIVQSYLIKAGGREVRLRYKTKSHGSVITPVPDGSATTFTMTYKEEGTHAYSRVEAEIDLSKEKFAVMWTACVGAGNPVMSKGRVALDLTALGVGVSAAAGIKEAVLDMFVAQPGEEKDDDDDDDESSRFGKLFVLEVEFHTAEALQSFQATEPLIHLGAVDVTALPLFRNSVLIKLRGDGYKAAHDAVRALKVLNEVAVGEGLQPVKVIHKALPGKSLADSGYLCLQCKEPDTAKGKEHVIVYLERYALHNHPATDEQFTVIRGSARLFLATGAAPADAPPIAASAADDEPTSFETIFVSPTTTSLFNVGAGVWHALRATSPEGYFLLRGTPKHKADEFAFGMDHEVHVGLY